MDLEVFIKDEDLEMRTPLRSTFSPSELDSSDGGNQDDDAEIEVINDQSGRVTNVSVYDLNSQDGQRNNSRLKSHETGDERDLVTDSRLQKFAS